MLYDRFSVTQFWSKQDIIRGIRNLTNSLKRAICRCVEVMRLNAVIAVVDAAAGDDVGGVTLLIS